ncbi:TonB C-terminal domain-containing protein [Campylobacter curvus]|uniref:TonB C-terminal domain-containing protein n=1 Tax=Campylobacter curvus TaxID=200 RepID=UPI0003707033|nr:TonB C-terminal domain-containing protein [Campylobacter curvus]QKF61762.1 Tol-Pal system subunit TolA [Campylobacter curvus]UEB50057.1 TonB C-terminal domain-containing protein [Campylobacter curvus]
MPSKVKFPTVSSFFVALSLYLTIVLMLFIKLTFFSEPAKKYTDDKDAFMDVVMVDREVAETIKAPKQANEIVKQTQPEPKKESQEAKVETTNKPVVPEEPLPTPSIPTPPKEQPKPELKPKPKPEIPEPSEKPDTKPEPPKPVETPNIKDLFSSIDTTKLKKDNGIAKPEQKVQSRKKSEVANSQAAKQASDIIKSLQIDTVSKAPKSQATGVYDPLRGAIAKQIQRRWQSYKADSNDVATVKFMIDGSGNFSYEILELSYNEEFNNKVRECLEKLTTEKFPFSPDGKSITFNLKLEDKLE